jgi:hypothetical protein
MSLFGSKKAEYEYVHACIEVTGFEIGDFEVDSDGSGYDEIEVEGNFFEIRFESKSSVASGRVGVNFGRDRFRHSLETGTLGLMGSQILEGVFGMTQLALTSGAQRDLANELRWRSPKFLTIEGRREKGSQGNFDVLGVRFKQDSPGSLQYENLKTRAQVGSDG